MMKLRWNALVFFGMRFYGNVRRVGIGAGRRRGVRAEQQACNV